MVEGDGAVDIADSAMESSTVHFDAEDEMHL